MDDKSAQQIHENRRDEIDEITDLFEKQKRHLSRKSCRRIEQDIESLKDEIESEGEERTKEGARRIFELKARLGKIRKKKIVAEIFEVILLALLITFVTFLVLALRTALRTGFLRFLTRLFICFLAKACACFIDLPCFIYFPTAR